jgi:hypothetical protein
MHRIFNRDKYKELVLFVVRAGAPNANFGSVLLNKILVDSDFSVYRELGQPLTGQRIQHEKMGPISVPLVPLTRDMEEIDGTLETSWGEFYGHSQKKYRALRDADLGKFSEEEIDIIGRCIDAWLPLNAEEASLESHRHFGGWSFTNNSEEIPYESAFLSMRPLSQDDRDYALELVPGH